MLNKLSFNLMNELNESETNSISIKKKVIIESDKISTIKESEEPTHQVLNEENSDAVDRLFSGNELYFRNADGTAIMIHYADNYPQPEEYDEGYKTEFGGNEADLNAAQLAAENGDVWELVEVDNEGNSTGTIYGYAYGIDELKGYLKDLREIKVKKSLEEASKITQTGGNMTVGEFYQDSIDKLKANKLHKDMIEVYDTDIDYEGPTWVIGDELTEEGKERFKEFLNLKIQKLIDDKDEYIIYVDTHENVKLIDDFLQAQSGNISEKLYDKYFTEVEIIEEDMIDDNIEAARQDSIEKGLTSESEEVDLDEPNEDDNKNILQAKKDELEARLGEILMSIKDRQMDTEEFRALSREAAELDSQITDLDNQINGLYESEIDSIIADKGILPEIKKFDDKIIRDAFLNMCELQQISIKNQTQVLQECRRLSGEEPLTESGEEPNEEVEKDNENNKPITEANVSKKIMLKNQGNVYMFECKGNKDFTHIVGENFNESENLLENVEVYSSKEEADKDYNKRCGLKETEIAYTFSLSLPDCEPVDYTNDYSIEEAKKNYMNNEGKNSKYTIDDIEIEEYDEPKIVSI